MCTSRRFLRASPRRRTVYDSIAVEGCNCFIQNTQRTLALLSTLSVYSTIRANVTVIKEMGWKHRNARCLATIDVDSAQPSVHVMALLGEKEMPLRYAGVLAHEAFHNELFSKGQPYVGPEAEPQMSAISNGGPAGNEFASGVD